MRTRTEIEETDVIPENHNPLRENQVTQELILEVLLDIRELLDRQTWNSSFPVELLPKNQSFQLGRQQ
jgi:hypothetical protein